MKKIIILTLMLVFTSKTNIKAQTIGFSTSASLINYLEGGWTWFRSCGGMTGVQCVYPSTVGYTKGVVFSKIPSAPDSLAYRAYKNGALVQSGSTKPSSVTVSSTAMWNLKIKGLSLVEDFSIFSSKPDTLFLDESCADCFGQSYYRDMTVGIRENIEEITKIKLFPLPAHSSIHIAVKEDIEIKKVTFYNLNNQEISMNAISDQEYNISDLPNGIYFIKIESGSQQYRARFVKN